MSVVTNVVAPPEMETLAVSSGVLMEERKIIWEVKNFDVIRISDGLTWAQKFEVELGSTIGLPTTWTFFLEPDKDDFGAFFKLLKKPDNVKEVNIAFSVKINKRNGEKYFFGKAALKNMADVHSWGFSNMTKDRPDIKTVLKADGSIEIEVEIKLYNPTSAVRLDVPSKLRAFEAKSLEQLSKDFLNTESLTGVNADSATKIVTSDGAEIPVNRGILSARSAVFQRMFQSAMREAKTGRVVIDDISSRSATVLIQYINTGTLHKCWKRADVIEELTYAAHKYELKLLTEFFDDVLGNICKIGNAKRLAVLAKKLGMKKAEKDLFAFIKVNATSLDDLMET